MSKVPRHVAIIPDGNGRWAEERNRNRSAGHRQGIEALEEVVDTALVEGIGVITVYGFSTENWSRTGDEVDELMKLLRDVAFKKQRVWRKKNVRFRFIGRRDRMPAFTLEALQQLEFKTRTHTRLTLVAALDYGGRDEIRRAVTKLISAGKTRVTEQDVSQALDTRSIPDPDLIIRTGGELRLSNFLLWQSTYSELYFTPKLWPDFSGEDLLEALAEYRIRKRRFGSYDDRKLLVASHSKVQS